jgi:hypothetical protein
LFHRRFFLLRSDYLPLHDSILAGQQTIIRQE